ncbi:GTPase-activating protein [Ascosphaera atra]|nr:GTPase-activating protein [Ascosphaera atra]
MADHNFDRGLAVPPDVDPIAAPVAANIGDVQPATATLETEEKGNTVTEKPSNSDIPSDAKYAPNNGSAKGSDGNGGGNKKENSLEAKQVSADEQLDASLAHLPEHERAILKEQLYIPPKNITWFGLYRYATAYDLLLVVISAIAAVGGGILFGQMAGSFQKIFLGSIEYSQFKKDLEKYALYFVYLGIAELGLVYISTFGWILSGERVSQKIRARYLEAILRQNMAYFDTLGAGEITTRITADTNLVQEGISEKVGLTIDAVATFITAFVIGFIKYWKLTLILCSSLVAIITTMGGASRFIIKCGKMSLDSYGAGGTIAEEVISSIRNATAFGTQERLAKQYDVHLRVAESWGRKLKICLGILIGILMGLVSLTHGLSLWESSRLLVQGDTNLQKVLTVVMVVLMGAFRLGEIGPRVQAFMSAVSAGSKIYSAIDRVSPIDPTSGEGEKLEQVTGLVEFKNIKHIYPSRPEVTVMEDVSLVVPPGKVTALVGPSGSGKSTVVGLLERFYNPVNGQVLLDGHDITTLNIQWLRQQIALVSQEPTLFGTTIYNNIRHGLVGSPMNNEPEEKVRERIENAAKLANAHEFISALPEGYETNVGQRGFLLSGGQKQRIAIARAIVSDPKILLLDEATSALDTKSEGVVQAALDAASQGRTTIVIAHRLSTIKNADNIVVLVDGKIVEQGTHEYLVGLGGTYANLVQTQKLNEEREANAMEEDEEVEGVEAGYQPVEMNEKQAMLERERSVTQKEIYDLEMQKLPTKESVSGLILSKQESEKEQKYDLVTLLRFVFTFNKPEMTIMCLAFLAAFIAGGGPVCQSVFFAKAIATLALPPETMAHKLRSDANFWAGMFLMLAFVMFFSEALNGGLFGICSEALIFRARSTAFRIMLRQDISFFDREENSTGALTSFLSTETTSLAGVSGATLGTILKSVVTLTASIVLALCIGWKLALVCTAVVPVILVCGFLRFHMLAQFEARSKKAYEGSAGYACEATSAIRTVAALTRESDVWDTYYAQLTEQARKGLVSILRASFLYAAAQSVTFFCMALGFWFGGRELGKGNYSMFQFFVCFMSIIFGAQSAGIFFSFAPDMGKARSAAAVFKNLFDRKPSIDTWSDEGQMVESMQGHIEFRDVHFRYPTRPQQPVLRGLNLTVKPGQYVALVGASGCGKSTTIALLERFYDPTSGGVLVDGTDISQLNVNSYRKQLALVSQEPTLYQGTIKDNILLGLDDYADVPQSRVEEVCKAANIYDFILSLPEGFDTVVGSKGSMLSGGQKQRVAIARALIRNPKVLLLDEATSALDSESEKVVQAALDAAARGRTTVAVAHRLSTIQNADVIYVFDQGRIVESGTHGELLHRKGRYFELVAMQNLGTQ